MSATAVGDLLAALVIIIALARVCGALVISAEHPRTGDVRK
jgi:hypothetical protein